MATKILCLFLFIIFVEDSVGSFQDDIARKLNKTNRAGAEPTLSRRRRYLTFPDGSSLQLVYCLTMPSEGVGEIFVFGATAALAWELPSDTTDLLLLKRRLTTEPPSTTPPHHYVDYEDHHPSKRIDQAANYFSGGWTSDNNEYPGTVKSYNDPFLMKKLSDYGYSPARPAGKPQYHLSRVEGERSSYTRRNRLPDSDETEPTGYIHPVFHDIHRRTRRELYGKIEKLFNALSKDGRACLKKAICEVSQVPKGKGTLMEEILKAVFRIKPHQDYPDEDEYDKAANINHNCTEQYPTCKHSVWTNMFL